MEVHGRRSRRRCRLSGSCSSTTRAAARPRAGAVLLPAEAREPPRGALWKTSSSSRRIGSGSRGLDPRHGADRDILAGLRDGGDPLRAARTTRPASTRAAGTHLQRDQKFRNRPDFVLPDARVTMTVPFMRAYTELLVKTCHAAGASAMGGMPRSSVAQGSGGQPRSRSRRARRQGASRATASTGRGSRTRILVLRAMAAFRRGARQRRTKDRPPAAEVNVTAGRPAVAPGNARERSRAEDRTNVSSASATSRLAETGTARPRSTT